jgi:stage II sporulation protein P
MSKNRSAYVVVVLVLAVLCFWVAWSQYGSSTAQASAGAPQAASSQAAAGGQLLSLTPSQQPDGTVQAESKDVNIVIDGNKAAGLDAKTDAAAQDKKDTQNPVAAFFSNLAATVSGNSSKIQASDAQAQQVSIEVGNENENTDQDVTDQVHIDVEKFPIEKSGNAAVLIYHTHTREAYTPEYPGQYVPVGTLRTDDKNNSVCAVGQKLTDLLSSKYGFSVTHDTTMNEAVPFTASYDKSLQTEQADIAKNPNLGIFIDVHRDSLGDTAFAQKDIVTQNGKQYARILFVVGRGDGLTGAEAPDWQANYAVAKAVSDQINKLMPGLSRGVMVKARRYNQQLSNKCLLIEFGYDANTITEAENSADIVAQALGTVLGK